MTGQGIGWAVKELRNGGRVRRSGWNGKGMWLILVVPPGRNELPYVLMKTADDMWVPWLCSQTDLLAVDWETVIDPVFTIIPHGDTL